MRSVGEFLGKAIGLEGHIKDIPDGYAIFISAVLIIIGWYIAKRANETSERRRNAHLYIIEHNDKLKSLIAGVADNLKSKKSFPDYDPNSDNEPNLVSLRRLLGTMEILATDIKHGLVSEKYIRDTQYSVTVDVFELSKNYICGIRENRKQNSAYHNYECLYIRFRYKKTSFIQRLVEWIINRPVFKITSVMFKIKYTIASMFLHLERDYMKETNENVSNAISKFDAPIYVLYTVILAGAIYWII